MRYVAAFLLATLGGKSNPSKADVQGILESIGLDVDDEKLSKVAIVALTKGRWAVLGVINGVLSKHVDCYMLQVFSELDGKDINEVISEGMGKLASMPSGTATLQSSYIS